MEKASCEQQLDLSILEHHQRDVTDGMRTPWKLPVSLASKNYVCLSSACPEVPVESCFFDDPILFKAIGVFQPCACDWCCNTKTSASPVLLTSSSVLCSLFLFCHSYAYTRSCCHFILTRAYSAWLISDLNISHTFLVAEPVL